MLGEDSRATALGRVLRSVGVVVVDSVPAAALSVRSEGQQSQGVFRSAACAAHPGVLSDIAVAGIRLAGELCSSLAQPHFMQVIATLALLGTHTLWRPHSEGAADIIIRFLP